MKKHFFNLALAGLLALVALAGCGKKDDPEPEPVPDPPQPVVETKYSLKPLAEMTLREKVGQLFNVRPEALLPQSSGYVTGEAKDITDFFKEYPCGGITLLCVLLLTVAALRGSDPGTESPAETAVEKQEPEEKQEEEIIETQHYMFH